MIVYDRKFQKGLRLNNWIPQFVSLDLNFTIPPDQPKKINKLVVDIILAFRRSVKSIQNIVDFFPHAIRLLPAIRTPFTHRLRCCKNGAQPIHTRVRNFASTVLWHKFLLAE